MFSSELIVRRIDHDRPKSVMFYIEAPLYMVVDHMFCSLCSDWLFTRISRDEPVFYVPPDNTIVSSVVGETGTTYVDTAKLEIEKHTKLGGYKEEKLRQKEVPVSHTLCLRSQNEIIASYSESDITGVINFIRIGSGIAKGIARLSKDLTE